MTNGVLYMSNVVYQVYTVEGHFFVKRLNNTESHHICETDSEDKAILIADLLREREEYDRQETKGRANNYVPWDSTNNNT